MKVKILYEDADILVVEKPAGMESQSTRKLEPDMVSEIRTYLSTKSSTRLSTGGEPYVGVIHRLDKPVGGVMVYAKHQKAAASLSKQVQDGRMEKTYWAVVCGKPVDIVGNYVDYLFKDGKKNCSMVVDKSKPGAKRAELSYRVLKTAADPETSACVSLVEIRLHTGRHHQIRVQFSSRGLPLWGDGKYNPRFAGGMAAGSVGGVVAGSAGETVSGATIGRRVRVNPALAAVRLSLEHPTTGKRMEFSMEPKGGAFGWFALETE